MHTVEEAGFAYLIRKSADDRVDRFVENMDHDVAVKQTHEMEKTIQGETVTVTPTLVGVPSDRKEDATVTFVTNLSVSDATKMGDLAKIEHEQKLQRVQSGIRAAQRAGTWTGRPPRGFDIDEDGRLHVDTETFLETREALARLARGESKNVVAENTGIPRSTLVRLYEDDQRRAMYLDGTATDDRLDGALDELRPLPEIDIDEAEEEELRAVIRDVVRDELD